MARKSDTAEARRSEGVGTGEAREDSKYGTGRSTSSPGLVDSVRLSGMMGGRDLQSNVRQGMSNYGRQESAYENENARLSKKAPRAASRGM
jgi:hypothetical protein